MDEIRTCPIRGNGNTDGWRPDHFLLVSRAYAIGLSVFAAFWSDCRYVLSRLHARMDAAPSEWMRSHRAVDRVPPSRVRAHSAAEYSLRARRSCRTDMGPSLGSSS